MAAAVPITRRRFTAGAIAGPLSVSAGLLAAPAGCKPHDLAAWHYGEMVKALDAAAAGAQRWFFHGASTLQAFGIEKLGHSGRATLVFVEGNPDVPASLWERHVALPAFGGR